MADDNVTRLKKQLEDLSDVDPVEHIELIRSVITRLEAAEEFCMFMSKVPDLRNMDWFIEGSTIFRAWCKKVAGK